MKNTTLLFLFILKINLTREAPLACKYSHHKLCVREDEHLENQGKQQAWD